MTRQPVVQEKQSRATVTRRLLLDLADAIFELQAVLGDVARRQRRRDGAQLAHQGRTRLLVNRPAGSSVILRQRRDRPAQQLLVVRHGSVGTHNCSDVL